MKNKHNYYKFSMSRTIDKGISVLIGITLAELVFAIAYYLFLRYLLKNFDKKYKNKDTVKKFSSTA